MRDVEKTSAQKELEQKVEQLKKEISENIKNGKLPSLNLSIPGLLYANVILDEIAQEYLPHGITETNPISQLVNAIPENTVIEEIIIEPALLLDINAIKKLDNAADTVARSTYDELEFYQVKSESLLSRILLNNYMNLLEFMEQLKKKNIKFNHIVYLENNLKNVLSVEDYADLIQNYLKDIKHLEKSLYANAVFSDVMRVTGFEFDFIGSDDEDDHPAEHSFQANPDDSTEWRSAAQVVAEDTLGADDDSMVLSELEGSFDDSTLSVEEKKPAIPEAVLPDAYFVQTENVSSDLDETIEDIEFPPLVDASNNNNEQEQKKRDLENKLDLIKADYLIVKGRAGNLDSKVATAEGVIEKYDEIKKEFESLCQSPDYLALKDEPEIKEKVEEVQRGKQDALNAVDKLFEKLEKEKAAAEKLSQPSTVVVKDEKSDGTNDGVPVVSPLATSSESTISDESKPDATESEHDEDEDTLDLNVSTSSGEVAPGVVSERDTEEEDDDASVVATPPSEPVPLVDVGVSSPSNASEKSSDTEVNSPDIAPVVPPLSEPAIQRQAKEEVVEEFPILFEKGNVNDFATYQPSYINHAPYKETFNPQNPLDNNILAGFSIRDVNRTDLDKIGLTQTEKEQIDSKEGLTLTTDTGIPCRLRRHDNNSLDVSFSKKDLPDMGEDAQQKLFRSMKQMMYAIMQLLADNKRTVVFYGDDKAIDAVGMWFAFQMKQAGLNKLNVVFYNQPVPAGQKLTEKDLRAHGKLIKSPADVNTHLNLSAEQQKVVDDFIKHLPEQMLQHQGKGATNFSDHLQTLSFFSKVKKELDKDQKQQEQVQPQNLGLVS